MVKIVNMITCKFCHIEIELHYNYTTRKIIPVDLDGQVHKCIGIAHKIKPGANQKNNNSSFSCISRIIHWR